MAKEGIFGDELGLGLGCVIRRVSGDPGWARQILDELHYSLA